MTEKFVQTVSSVNYNKGVFSLYFVGQDQKNMANGVMAESDNDLELKQVVHMPASGFMYMVSMIKNMLEDPRMEAEFDKLVAAGFLPAGDAAVNQAEESPAETLVEEKAAPKKRTSQAKKITAIG
ncbi:peptide chain release factor 1 [Vibrio sp. 03_296]|nr:peptide chain release factor 1 [Vibrio sp. 03_296]OZT82309.1 peptide chain release factor 1 [Vibrio sp. 03_296]